MSVGFRVIGDWDMRLRASLGFSMQGLFKVRASMWSFLPRIEAWGVGARVWEFEFAPRVCVFAGQQVNLWQFLTLTPAGPFLVCSDYAGSARASTNNAGLTGKSLADARLCVAGRRT